MGAKHRSSCRGASISCSCCSLRASDSSSVAAASAGLLLLLPLLLPLLLSLLRSRAVPVTSSLGFAPEASEPDCNLVEASEPDCNLAERRTQNSSAGAIATPKPSHAAKASRNASRKGRNAAECMYLWGRGAVVSTCMHGRSSVAINGRGHVLT
jgi:hypothetical protein